jgi:alkaline phosphatase D
MTRAAALLFFVSIASASSAADGPQLAMGFKVGEVTSNSAIIWTRLTAEQKVTSPELGKPQSREAMDAEIAKLPGHVSGMAGKVNLQISTVADFSGWISAFITGDVGPERDFTHQWSIEGLKPAIRYFVRVTAHGADGQITAKVEGSFTTAAPPDKWQDVSFAVITGQAYKDLDHAAGFHIYPAMQKAGIQLLVPTGDTVYYDSDPPLANTVEMARHHWHRMYALPRHVEFHRFVPGYWEKDDHDTVKNDCWPPQGKNADRSDELTGNLTFFKGLKIFREQVPMGDKTYRTFRWGKGLQVWLVEGRDFRSANNAPDGPDKTIWGREQLEWLQSSILSSDADFRVLVSPTPIVGPDRGNKADNHANTAFATEGNAFRKWTQENKLTGKFFVCCGDRHWQYHSVDPATGLHEFSCGPASDKHAGGSPGLDAEYHKFHRVRGGFLTVSVARPAGEPTAAFRFHDVQGQVVHEHLVPAARD